MSLGAGTRLGPYEVVSALGAGGMGEVYRARDTRLGRDVAIKVLPTAFAADPDRLRRFEQEARAIAALNHPHICQIYDVGPAYLVLEYIEGAPVQGPLPVEASVRVAIQIAGALEAAHARGILHRDLKPGNILMTRTGHVKVLDFGLAKSIAADADVTRTTAGAVLGTPAYMSPEQAEGKPLDVRSDIFSLGAVLYELLSGTRAFGGDTTAQVVSAVLRDAPPPLQAPLPLERLVSRCLAKQAAQRFQTMTEVKAALEQVSEKPADRQPSIAVLPFADMSEAKDQEWFSDGLAEDIINALTHVPDLKVIARTSAFAFKGRHDDIRRIADVLGVAHVLEGSVRRAGNRIRVTAQLIIAEDGSHLWSERYDRELADIFAIQDDIAQAIAAALEVKLARRPTEVRRHTPTLPAYEAFLRGRHHLFKLNPDSLAHGIALLKHAIALDPLYAQPHAELGLCYLFSTTNGDRPMREVAHLIRAEAEASLALDPSEPAPHFLLASLAAICDYDPVQAEAQFQRALATTSTRSDLHWAYASFFLQPFGRFEEAVSQMEQAVEHDPLNVFWRGVLTSHLTHAQLYERAIQQATEALKIDPGSYLPHFTLGEAYVALGRWHEAVATLEHAHRIVPQDALSAGMLAGALVHLGDKTRAEQLVQEMGENARPVFGRVLYHILCGHTDLAADWYKRAIDEHDPLALVFANGPVTRAFRETTRWPTLARMMRLHVDESVHE